MAPPVLRGLREGVLAVAARIASLVGGQRSSDFGGKAVFWTGAAIVGSQLLMSLGAVITARALGPAGKGVATSALTWSQLLVWVSLAGLNRSAAVRVAAFPSQAGSAVGQGIAYSAVVGGVLSLATLATLPSLLSHLSPDASRTATLAVVSIPLMMLSEILLSVNIAYGQTRVFNMCRLLSPAAMLLVIGYLMMAKEVSPFTVVLANIIGVSIALVVAAFALPLHRIAFRLRALLGDLRFGVKLQLGGLLELANLRLDILLMSLLAPASQIGLYSVANNAMLPVITIGSAAALLLTPAIARMGGSGGDLSSIRHRQIDLTRAQARRYGLFAAVGGAALAVLAPLFIPVLFGKAFEPTVVLVWILIPGFLGRAFIVNVVAGATGMRQAWVGNVVEGTGFVVTVVLLPVLLFRFGVAGAALASTCAYLSSAVAAWLCLRLLTERTASSSSIEPIVVRPSA